MTRRARRALAALAAAMIAQGGLPGDVDRREIKKALFPMAGPSTKAQARLGQASLRRTATARLSPPPQVYGTQAPVLTRSP